MHQMCVSVGLQRGFFWSVFLLSLQMFYTNQIPQDDWGDSQSEL